jgi:hypothetical protein
MKIRIMEYDDPFCHDPDCEICGLCRDAIGKTFDIDDELSFGGMFAVMYKGEILYFLAEEVEICQ